MAEIIYKYHVTSQENLIAECLSGPVLHVGFQDSIPTLWIAGDVNTRVPRRFRIVTTGEAWERPAGAIHRGTAQESDQLFVWHLYELTDG